MGVKNPALSVDLKSEGIFQENVHWKKCDPKHLFWILVILPIS
jgi:hypothetical protein